MGLFSKIFGKGTETEKPKAIVPDLSFVELQDAVAFKSEATNWIRAQNLPLGTLMWFTLPNKINQFYQPCFGVLANPVLFEKLDRAESFDLACSPVKSLSSFQWGINFNDPDNPSTQITLVTEPIAVDENSLIKLRYVAEHVRAPYFFYASEESSNFLYIEMFPEFNEKLYQLCVSLKKAQTDSSNISEKEQTTNKTSASIVGAHTPAPTVSREEGPLDGLMGVPQISETNIELEDGTTIQLSNIKEIADGQQVLGAPNHPLVRAINVQIERGRGVVYLLYVTKDGPSTAVIPVADQSTAVAIIEQLKKAKDSLKKQKSAKVIVGECPECHRKLRVKGHAVKQEMVLTCKCGKVNVVHVPSEVSDN